MTPEEKARAKPIPEAKKQLVATLAENITNNRTTLIASCKSLPGQQFHEIKKKLRTDATMKVAKKSAVIRAIDSIEKGALKQLKEHIHADIVLLFSNSDPFVLSGMLTENQSPAKAKPGDVSPEDIEIEAGPTELPPGPAISELGAVGLKVAVKDGKLEIMQGAVVAKAGETITPEVASVLGKLDITPMQVGFIPLAAYDAEADAVYADIVIDKEGTLESLRNMLGKALGFAVNLGYPAKETINYFISKAAVEEKALGKLMSAEEPGADKAEEKKQEESAAEETSTEEQKEASSEEPKTEESSESDSPNKDAKEDTA